ncbi:MAG: hypothetical protein RR620_07950 [Clostridium sp.]
MYSIDLVRTSSPCESPSKYTLIFNGPFNMACEIRKRVPKYLYDKNSTIIITTVICGDGRIIKPCPKASFDLVAMSYLYDATPIGCTCSKVYNMKLAPCNNAVAPYINKCLPMQIISDDESLVLNFIPDRMTNNCANHCRQNCCFNDIFLLALLFL